MNWRRRRLSYEREKPVAVEFAIVRSFGQQPEARRVETSLIVYVVQLRKKSCRATQSNWADRSGANKQTTTPESMSVKRWKRPNIYSNKASQSTVNLPRRELSCWAAKRFAAVAYNETLPCFMSSRSSWAPRDAKKKLHICIKSWKKYCSFLSSSFKWAIIVQTQKLCAKLQSFFFRQ